MKIKPHKAVRTDTMVLYSFVLHVFHRVTSFGLAWSLDGSYWHESGKPETAKFFSYDKKVSDRSTMRNLFVGRLALGFCIFKERL